MVDFDAYGKPSLKLSFRISKQAGKLDVDDLYGHNYAELVWEPGVKKRGDFMIEDFKGEPVGQLKGPAFPEDLRRLATTARDFERIYRITFESNTPRKSSYMQTWNRVLQVNERKTLEALFKPKMTPFTVSIWFINELPELETLEDQCLAFVRKAIMNGNLVQDSQEQIVLKLKEAHKHMGNELETLQRSKKDDGERQMSWYQLTEEEWDLRSKFC